MQMVRDSESVRLVEAQEAQEGSPVDSAEARSVQGSGMQAEGAA